MKSLSPDSVMRLLARRGTLSVLNACQLPSDDDTTPDELLLLDSLVEQMGEAMVDVLKSPEFKGTNNVEKSTAVLFTSMELILSNIQNSDKMSSVNNNQLFSYFVGLVFGALAIVAIKEKKTELLNMLVKHGSMLSGMDDVKAELDGTKTTH